MRRKCHFLLALCSVFIVVLFCLVINTIVARGPIIFLKLAEANQGEIDGFVVPSSSYRETDDLVGDYLNYTRVKELYGDKYNLAPRKTFCNSFISSDYQNPSAGFNNKTGKASILSQSGKSQYEEWVSNFDKETGLPTRINVYTSDLQL